MKLFMGRQQGMTFIGLLCILVLCGIIGYAGVRLVPSSRVTARDIMDTNYVLATREALEKLQESLG